MNCLECFQKNFHPCRPHSSCPHVLKHCLSNVHLHCQAVIQKVLARLVGTPSCEMILYKRQIVLPIFMVISAGAHDIGAGKNYRRYHHYAKEGLQENLSLEDTCSALT